MIITHLDTYTYLLTTLDFKLSYKVKQFRSVKTEMILRRRRFDQNSNVIIVRISGLLYSRWHQKDISKLNDL